MDKIRPDDGEGSFYYSITKIGGLHKGEEFVMDQFYYPRSPKFIIGDGMEVEYVDDMPRTGSGKDPTWNAVEMPNLNDLYQGEMNSIYKHNEQEYNKAEKYAKNNNLTVVEVQLQTGSHNGATLLVNFSQVPLVIYLDQDGNVVTPEDAPDLNFKDENLSTGYLNSLTSEFQDTAEVPVDESVKKQFFSPRGLTFTPHGDKVEEDLNKAQMDNKPDDAMVTPQNNSALWDALEALFDAGGKIEDISKKQLVDAIRSVGGQAQLEHKVSKNRDVPSMWNGWDHSVKLQEPIDDDLLEHLENGDIMNGKILVTGIGTHVEPFTNARITIKNGKISEMVNGVEDEIPDAVQNLAKFYAENLGVSLTIQTIQHVSFERYGNNLDKPNEFRFLDKDGKEVVLPITLDKANNLLNYHSSDSASLTPPEGVRGSHFSNDSDDHSHPHVTNPTEIEVMPAKGYNNLGPDVNM